MPARLLPLLAAFALVAGSPPSAAQPKRGELASITVAGVPELTTAVKPKQQSEAVKKGLGYLVKSQREDGGWDEGEVPALKSDMANTSLALLALVRAGNTPDAGEYKEAVAKGLKFVLKQVEAADTDTLTVGEGKDSMIHLKLGSATDAFLVTRLLAELRGKAGSEEKRLIAALKKTTAKIVKHQTAEGFFPDTGITPVLSVALGNAALARARIAGVGFDDRVLERAFKLSETSANGTVMITPRGLVGMPVIPVEQLRKAGKLPDFVGKLPKIDLSGLDTAGVTLYRVAQGAGNSQMIVSALRADAGRLVLKGSKAGDRAKARQTLNRLKQAEAANDKIQAALAKHIRNDAFVAGGGFGFDGGEEFLSFLYISEALVARGGKDWESWDDRMVKKLEKAQTGDGSWAGKHCVTGKTFCTSTALLVLMADRTPFPAGALAK